MQHAQHGAASPAASSAPPMQRGVCIVNSDAEAAVDAPEITRLGYKLRTSPSCLPSMLVTGTGCTIAFVLLNDSQGDEVWDRIDRVRSKGFPNAFVIVKRRDRDMSSSRMLQAVCRYQGNPAFVHAAPGQTFTQAALNIAIALTGEKLDSLFEQKCESLASPDSFVEVLMDAPGLMVTEPEAEEVTQMGSLSDIASATAHDIALRTRIQPDRAAEIVQFFSQAPSR